MADIATHFPPQTYSSSFFLNTLADDEKNPIVDTNNVKEANSAPLLDCFISTFFSGEKRSTRTKPNSDTQKAADNKDIEVAADIWKNRHASIKPSSVRTTTDSPHSTFKRWRKSVAGLKLSESKNAINSSKLTVNNYCFDRGASEEDMSLLKFLAINALDLSAPASDVLLKGRKSNWFQLSGHPDSLAPAGPGTVWKKRSCGSDDTERLVYEELSRDDSLCDIIPKYYREVDYKGEKFIELQDLLHGFQDPHMIDIKMGTRTFLESEVRKTVLRPDLYQKMIAVDPSAPTCEEHVNKAVTKLRYMQFRELQSSSCSHGFRIEAMKCRGSAPVTDLKKVKSDCEVFDTLSMFLHGREDVRQRLLRRLYEVRTKIEQSDYFKTREVVGSSLFVIYDDNKVGVWLIDFAKTNKLPDGLTVNHRSTWIQGNHEEGLLFGFDRLITLIEKMTASSSSSSLKKWNKDSISETLPSVSVKS